MNKNQRVNNIRTSTRDIVQHLGYLNNLFASIGSLSQCYALQKLEKTPLTLQELTKELGLEQSTVSRLAKELVDKKGYCFYQPNGQDGRSHFLKLTDLGKKKLREIHTTATQQVQTALSQLTEAEQEAVARGLDLYATALKNKEENETHG